MSENIQRKDGGFVMILSKEEAELLGTFRFKHVTGKCQLYDILEGLPWTKGEFRTMQEQPPHFYEFVPGKDIPPSFVRGPVDVISAGVTGCNATAPPIFREMDFASIERRVLAAAGFFRFPMAVIPSGSQSIHDYIDDYLPVPCTKPKWAVECNFGIGGDKWLPSHNAGMDKLFGSEKEATDAFRNAPWFHCGKHTGKYRAVPAYPAIKLGRPKAKPTPVTPRKWVVQFNHSPYLAAGNWETLIRPSGRMKSLPAEGVYTSRNEAYRQIKLRAKHAGSPVTNYRVVPEGTAEGPESDRGFYRLQFWNDKTQAWLASADRKHYSSAEVDAASAGTGLTYRVKWYPNSAA